MKIFCVGNAADVSTDEIRALEELMTECAPLALHQRRMVTDLEYQEQVVKKAMDDARYEALAPVRDHYYANRPKAEEE